MERPARSRIARARRGHRRLVQAVEPAGRPGSRRSTAIAAVGDGPGGVRTGGLRLHGPGIRVRLERRDHRSRLRLAHDHWVAVRGAKRDPNFRSLTTVSDQQFDRLVRDLLKGLLAPRMVRTLVYPGAPWAPPQAPNPAP